MDSIRNYFVHPGRNIRDPLCKELNVYMSKDVFVSIYIYIPLSPESRGAFLV